MNPADLAFLAYEGTYPRRNRTATTLAIQVKRCCRCRQWRYLAEYGLCASRSDGHDNKCRSCATEYATTWTARPGNAARRNSYSKKAREKDPQRANMWRLESRCRAYGISADDYLALLDEQRGGCAICRKSPSANGGMLAVDHDHACCPTSMQSCGECVRGLLCRTCNMRVGVAESPIFDQVLDYLHRPLGPG